MGTLSHDSERRVPACRAPDAKQPSGPDSFFLPGPLAASGCGSPPRCGLLLLLLDLLRYWRRRVLRVPIRYASRAHSGRVCSSHSCTRAYVCRGGEVCVLVGFREQLSIDRPPGQACAQYGTTLAAPGRMAAAVARAQVSGEGTGQAGVADLGHLRRHEEGIALHDDAQGAHSWARDRLKKSMQALVPLHGMKGEELGNVTTTPRPNGPGPEAARTCRRRRGGRRWARGRS